MKTNTKCIIIQRVNTSDNYVRLNRNDALTAYLNGAHVILTLNDREPESAVIKQDVFSDYVYSNMTLIDKILFFKSKYCQIGGWCSYWITDFTFHCLFEI
jgi:hypothetical protein